MNTKREKLRRIIQREVKRQLHEINVRSDYDDSLRGMRFKELYDLAMDMKRRYGYDRLRRAMEIGLGTETLLDHLWDIKSIYDLPVRLPRDTRDTDAVFNAAHEVQRYLGDDRYMNELMNAASGDDLRYILDDFV